jgi:hypothetical protein
MSIANNITGGGGGSSASQLLDLLANPDAYQAKLQAMENATAEYKKYVDAVGVATEINAIRDQVKANQAQADAEITEAKALAVKIATDAQTEADAKLAAAQATADELTTQASANKAEASALLAQAKKAMQQAEVAQAVADNAKASADAQAAMLFASQETADQTLAQAQALKADILAKHKAFIESL